LRIAAEDRLLPIPRLQRRFGRWVHRHEVFTRSLGPDLTPEEHKGVTMLLLPACRLVRMARAPIRQRRLIEHNRGFAAHLTGRNYFPE
jgi:hypothetical protein